MVRCRIMRLIVPKGGPRNINFAAYNFKRILFFPASATWAFREEYYIVV